MRKAHAVTRDPRERYVAILDQLCEQGRLGRKSGAGYYRYAENRQVRASDAVVRDIDVALVQGYGFPRWEGGPVFWARQQDRATIEVDLQALAREAGHSFVPADLSVLLD